MKPQEIIPNFDLTAAENLGRPRFFDVDHYLDSVEQMVSADEVIFALEMIDRMPAYYRRHMPKRASDLKANILSRITTVSKYATLSVESYDEALAYQSKLNPGYEWEKGLGAMIDIPFCQPRGTIAVNLVKELNEKGIVPHIWEMGPSNYYLPYGLILKNLKFTYYADSLQKEAKEEAKNRLESVWSEKPYSIQKQIFICFETIEHLWREEDILHQYHAYKADADYILVSTPCGTLLGGNPDPNREIEHLRTYYPEDLLRIVTKFWPNYEWSECISHMMVLVGKKKG